MAQVISAYFVWSEPLLGSVCFYVNLPDHMVMGKDFQIPGMHKQIWVFIAWWSASWRIILSLEVNFSQPKTDRWMQNAAYFSSFEPTLCGISFDIKCFVESKLQGIIHILDKFPPILWGTTLRGKNLLPKGDIYVHGTLRISLHFYALAEHKSYAVFQTDTCMSHFNILFLSLQLLLDYPRLSSETCNKKYKGCIILIT